MVKSIIILLSLLLCYPYSYSQLTNLTGVVIDKETKESIPFVHFASISNQRAGFISSENGTYEFQLILHQRDTFSISAIGYKSLKVPVSKLSKTDTVYMESKHIELNEFTVNAKPKTAKEIFKEALENFNSKEYQDQNFIGSYEEQLVSKDKQDTSFLRASCIITGYSPKEKVGLLSKYKFYEKVALLSVDSYKINTEYKMMNHLLHMTEETKINQLAQFSRGLDFEVTDTTINKDGHVVFKLSGSYSDDGSPNLKAVIDVTEKKFMQMRQINADETLVYQAVFSNYIDDGLPTRIEMIIRSDKSELLAQGYKGLSVFTTLTLHKKVTTPVETESWVEGTMFNGEIDLDLKEKLGY